MKIEKLDSGHVEIKTPQHRSKTAKRSILKVKGVIDPASSKKHSIIMMSERASKKRRKTIKNKIKHLKPKEMDQIANKSNLILSPSTPVDIKKQILYHGVNAGFLSLD
jgi:hypothetical protein